MSTGVASKVGSRRSSRSAAKPSITGIMPSRMISLGRSSRAIIGGNDLPAMLRKFEAHHPVEEWIIIGE
jgi:hypothetical protein